MSRLQACGLLGLLLAALVPSASGCAATGGGGGGGIVTTTTVAPNTCEALDDNSAGLTIDEGTTLQDAGVNEDPNAQCASCTSGTRQFYTGATSNVPSDAIGNAQVCEGVQCPTPSTFCTCNSAGVCCTPTGNVDTVLFIPFCTGGVCTQNVIVQGDSGAALTVRHSCVCCN
ncbi:hypothetical protein M3Y99_00168400 [Aphelenchoides fujianensis]|nr:hypothetical protein M3Y99_00168400 [Aphelenchoides fujianensis]